MELSSKTKRQGNPKSRLLSVAINLWKNAVTKSARRKRIATATDLESNETNLFADIHADAEAGVLSKMMRNALLETINRVEDLYRLPVLLFYAEGMKIAEISTLLRKPVGSVKRPLYEARKKSREKWRKWVMNDQRLDEALEACFQRKSAMDERLGTPYQAQAA